MSNNASRRSLNASTTVDTIELEDVDSVPNNASHQASVAAAGRATRGNPPPTVPVDPRQAAAAAAAAEEEEEEELKYGAESIIQLIVPVTLCMAIVVATIQSITYYAVDSGDYLYYVAFNEQGGSDASKFGGAIVNALIIIGVIIVMTCVLVALYKYRCYKIIWLWLFLSTVLLLFLFSYVYLQNVLDRYNQPFDWITFSLIIWNFGMVGVVAIHWKAPLRLQQAYLIVTSALLALTLIKHLPEWTTWVLLAAIAIYDLFAVLCPRGPLKVLVETAAERNEPIFPALIYSSTVMYMVVGTVTAGDPGSVSDSDDELEGAAPRETQATPPAPMSSSSSGANLLAQAESSETANEIKKARQSREAKIAELSQRDREVVRPTITSAPSSPGSTAGSTSALVNQHHASIARSQESIAAPPSQDEEDEARGVKLGLGDFIFYSVLVGKAATQDQWATIMAAFIAILVGLCLTLLLLAIYKRALPALPISIAFGILFYFVSNEIIVPFVDLLSSKQVFL